LLEGDSKHAADEAAVDSEGSAVDGGGERAAQVGNEVRDLLATLTLLSLRVLLRDPTSLGK
jgi:hypothetical protein